MKIRNACLAVVMRMVIALACLAGLTTTAAAQWWTNYNPNLIFGYWQGGPISGTNYDRWTLNLWGSSPTDVITDININVTNGANAFVPGTSDALSNPNDNATHFLLDRTTGSTQDFISLDGHDKVSTGQLCGCLSPTGSENMPGRPHPAPTRLPAEVFRRERTPSRSCRLWYLRAP